MVKGISRGTIGIIIAGVLALLAGLTGITVYVNVEEGKTSASITYSTEERPAIVEGDRGELLETDTIDGEKIPTVDEVDGGLFRDKDTGVSVTEGMYDDLGWSEWYPTSTPEAFRDATIGHCVYANNYWGAQCVSLARVFWWSYADRDVSTCGTGMAKGMMDCTSENAGNDFLVYWGSERVQAGDWLIWGTGMYGHVGMALGPVKDGYVTLLGENQGGKACVGGGAATNIINLNTNGVIGYYRPKAYVKPEPTPTPTPTPTPVTNPDAVAYTYVEGDYFSKVLVDLGLDENNLWGEDGTVAYYTRQLVKQQVLDERGNVLIGVPFTLVRR